MLKQITQDLKQSIRSLKRIAVEFENGTINYKTLLIEVAEIAKKLPPATLEDTLGQALGSPDSLKRKAINEAGAILCAFKAKMLEQMIATMQKLAAKKPRIPLRRYGGNVVETTPAALTVAMEYANNLAATNFSKNSAAVALALFKASMEQLEKLVVQHHDNIMTTANIRSQITAMLPTRNLSNITYGKQPTEEDKT